MSTLKVLVVAAEHALGEALEGPFRARSGALVWTATDRAARALTLLGQDPADLIISAAELADASGAEFFRAVRATPALREVAFILLDETAREVLQPSPYEAVLGREAQPTVVLASAAELLGGRLADGRAARQPSRPLQTKLRGALEVVSLFDLVFALAQKHNTGRIYLLLEGREASLFLREGRPVHAAYGTLTGEAAVTAMFAAAERRPDTEFYFEVGDAAATTSVTLHAPVQELLLGAAIALDRQRATP